MLSPPRKRGATGVDKKVDSRFRGNDRDGVVFEGAGGRIRAVLSGAELRCPETPRHFGGYHNSAGHRECGPGSHGTAASRRAEGGTGLTFQDCNLQAARIISRTHTTPSGDRRHAGKARVFATRCPVMMRSYRCGRRAIAHDFRGRGVTSSPRRGRGPIQPAESCRHKTCHQALAASSPACLRRGQGP